MRASLISVLLLSVVLAACASRSTVPPTKHIPQDGPLRVHPGLVGEPVPPELRDAVPLLASAPAPAQMPAPAAAAALPANVAEKAVAVDAVDLRTQRSVYFDYRDVALKPADAPLLQAHARYLAEHRSARVRVEGHADERGSQRMNRQLGRTRAENVRDALVAGGASARQIRVVSLGESRPQRPGHNEASWAENRRATLVYGK